jgi:renalase
MMLEAERIAVIGSGIAGLACARRLSDTGYAPILFDKGRGIGGRLATRRTPEGRQFDHGVQYITATAPRFEALLNEAETARAAALWADGSNRPHVVGTPGMTGLAKYLGRGLEIHQGTEVMALHGMNPGWTLTLASGAELFDRVVVTAPAPQLSNLLGPGHPMSREVAGVRLDPCVALMAAFDPDAPRPFVTRTDAEAPLAWIAQDILEGLVRRSRRSPS